MSLDRHPCALLVHFRRHGDKGAVLAAIGDLLLAELDDWGWTTDWTHPFLTKPRVGLWVFEGVAIQDDEDLDLRGKWRRPTPEELGRLTEGVPVWEIEEGSHHG